MLANIGLTEGLELAIQESGGTGYQLSYRVDGGEAVEVEGTSFTLPLTGDTTVQVINRKEAAIDTGVALEERAWLWMLGLCGALLAAALAWKGGRRRRGEEP